MGSLVLPIKPEDGVFYRAGQIFLGGILMMVAFKTLGWAVGLLLLLSAPIRAADVGGVAYSGSPFGVAKVTVQFDSEVKLPAVPLLVSEKEGRLFYPAFDRSRLIDTGGVESLKLTIYFLFQGDPPLDVELNTAAREAIEIEPVVDQDAHGKLLEEWWRYYQDTGRQAARTDTYQPLVENYLLATLSRRLKIPDAMPLQVSTMFGWDNLFSLLSGAESVRIAAQSKLLLSGTSPQQVANQPLPKPLDLPTVDLPEMNGQIAIEPIARYVPLECFYIRCGSYENFRWLRSTIDRLGTKVRDLTAVRAVDYQIQQRLEQQLALKETVLGKLLGNTVIADVAIIGSDAFVREGAALGILFEARSSTVLGNQIKAMRDGVLEADSAAKSEIVKIAGHDVQFLSAPGNRIRSFYAVDGKFHLVTTSKTIVKRFFEAGQGKRNLANSKEFRWARSKMPLTNNYNTFIYLSDPFFRQLIGPHYRIEMTRRTEAASAMDVVQLAQLAAKSEGQPGGTLQELTAADLLPSGFNTRPDDSHVVIANGLMTDSLRGAYGTFLPVPDVEIPRATQSEVLAYESFSSRYSAAWKRMDPVVVGIQREEIAGEKKERIIADVKITPYARSQYWFAEWLESPDKWQWAMVPGDILSVSARIKFT
ncbi:MAG: hypothetical protein N2C12_18115, partial [Planctomycetales bacterium]